MSGFQCEAKKLYPNEMFPKKFVFEKFCLLVKNKRCNPECRRSRYWKWMDVKNKGLWFYCVDLVLMTPSYYIYIFFFFFEVVMGGRAPPLRPYTGCTALCPFRDRERPVGQRSSVPKIDKTRRLDRENQNWNHSQKLSDAQKRGYHKRVHTAAKLIAWHKIELKKYIL